jgi:hypothetical protein
VNYDWSKIKLYTAKGTGSVGNPVFSKSLLAEMVGSSQYTIHHNINLLYFERLDISLEELEKKRYVKVWYAESAIKENGPHTLLIEKTETFGSLLKAVTTKLNLPERVYRVVEIVNNRRSRAFTNQDSIQLINEYGHLYVEVRA